MKRDKVILKENTNCGFSLIELIVVVLIIAIVAVALAPQVVKWVENSRISSDLQTLSDIENVCRLAITDEKVFERVKEGEYEIIISKDSTGIHYDYKPDDVDFSTDEFFLSFFKNAGYDDKTDFEDNVTIKCNPTVGNRAAIHVFVYIGGYTFGRLEGVVSDTIDIPTGSSAYTPDSP